MKDPSARRKPDGDWTNGGPLANNAPADHNAGSADRATGGTTG
jgi:hypothetical protein